MKRRLRDEDDPQFGDDQRPVPTTGFDYAAVERSFLGATAEEARGIQLELLKDALVAAEERGRQAGVDAALPHREQIERELLENIFSGRPTAGAVLTRAVAAGRTHGILTIEEAEKLSGSRIRAIQTAGAKMKLRAPKGGTRSRNCVRK